MSTLDSKDMSYLCVSVLTVISDFEVVLVTMKHCMSF